jgi:hypothetical protein
MLTRKLPDRDAPLNVMNAAALTFFDQVGSEGYIQWLRQELSRATVTQLRHGRLDQLREAADAAADRRANTEALLTEAANTLGWYADSLNYRDRKRTAAPVMTDGGELAREILLKIEGGDDAADDASA